MFDSLTSNYDWILRRVDTVRFLDGEMIERKVTLDLDLHELRTRAEKAGVTDSTIPLPLMQLAKRPLLDVDIADIHGQPLAIATSDQDSHLSSSLLLATLARRRVGLRRLSEGVLSQMHAIVKAPTMDDGLDILYAISPESFDEAPGGGRLDLSVTVSERRAWKRMLDVDEFIDRLLDYTESFLLVAQVDVNSDEDVAILKIRLVEERAVFDRQSRLLSPDRLGWTPQIQSIPMSGLGRAQRNHVRVLAPDDSVVRSTQMLEAGVPIHAVRDGKGADGGRAPLDRALFYRAHMKPGPYEMRVELEPARGPFLVPAALTMGLLMMLLIAAAALQWADARFTEASPEFVFVQRPDGTGSLSAVHSTQANFDAAVTVLAIVPSLIAIYIVRVGEHQLVTRLLTLPRILVLVSAFSTIVAAGATAASVAPQNLFVAYAFAASSTGIAFVMVCVPIVRVSVFRWLRRRVARSDRRRRQQATR